MNAIERKRYILDELQRNGSVVITDLAERIQVSSMTIRRDLNAMAEDGMVTLENNKPHGLRVKIRLPLADQKAKVSKTV